MTSWDSQRFLSGGRSAGVDPAVLANAVATAQRTLKANPRAPVILTLRHLAALCDVPYDYLRRVVARSETLDPYRVFALKRGGASPQRKPRIICAPEPLLLRAQRWIHSAVLVTGAPHSASSAYGKGCNIVDAAKQHCGASWLIKLDVSNFFESILEPEIYKVFRNLGYQPLVAFELARLCTRVRPSGNVARKFEQRYRISQYNSSALGHLPQGAPTSPLLANLACVDFDKEIATIAADRNLRYTRYADDLTLSFNGKGFSRRQASEVVGECYEVMKARSLWPNRTKTHVIPPGARKLVLGLLVDGKQPALTREFRDQMRAHLHYLERLGPAVHAKTRGFDSVVGLQNHVFGLASYAMGVDREWAKAVIGQLRKVPWPSAFEMPV